MNRGAIEEISALDPAAVVVKGDLTAWGTVAEYERFLEFYGGSVRLEAPSRARQPRRVLRRHVRGRRAVRRRRARRCASPSSTPTIPGIGDRSGHRGDARMARRRRGDRDERRRPAARVRASPRVEPAVEESRRALLRHQSRTTPTGSSTSRLAGPSFAGYFAGHTHRNRVRRFPATGDKPWVEVACVKDFPGSWAEYRVFDGGVMQVHRRISTARGTRMDREDPRHVRRRLHRLRLRQPRRSQLHRLTTTCRMSDRRVL